MNGADELQIIFTASAYPDTLSASAVRWVLVHFVVVVILSEEEFEAQVHCLILISRAGIRIYLHR